MQFLHQSLRLEYVKVMKYMIIMIFKVEIMMRKSLMIGLRHLDVSSQYQDFGLYTFMINQKIA